MKKVNDFKEILKNKGINVLKETEKNIYFECPFCAKGKKASFSKEKGLYTCWSCKNDGIKQATGNVESFRFYLTGKTTFKKENEPVARKVLKRIIEIDKTVLRNTEQGNKALKHLIKRGVNDKLIDKYTIGLSHSDEYLTGKLLKEVDKFTDKEILETGLFTKNEKGLKSILTGLITIPLNDIDGKLVSFVGLNWGEYEGPKSRRGRKSSIFKNAIEDKNIRINLLLKLQKDSRENRKKEVIDGKKRV